MYLARVRNVIHVLDCFKKKTGKTEKKDLARTEARYKKVRQRMIEDQRDGQS